MEETPDALRADFIGLSFRGIRTEFIELVRELTEEGLHPLEASKVALDLVNSLMVYTNNSKLCDSNVNMQLVSED